MAKFSFFRRKTSAVSGEVTLSSDLLQVLTNIDDEKDISQIARESGLPTAEFKACLSKLYKLGLIEPVTNTEQKYNSDFVKEIINEITFYVGPIAEMIIADTLSDLNITDERIPLSNLDKLISLLSDEIPDDDEKIKFKRNINLLAAKAR